MCHWCPPTRDTEDIPHAPWGTRWVERCHAEELLPPQDQETLSPGGTTIWLDAANGNQAMMTPDLLPPRTFPVTQPSPWVGF